MEKPGIKVTVFALALTSITFLAFETIPMIVLSGSMQPYMNPGDIVIVYRGVNPEKLEVGDVITFKVHLKRDTVVTHRIVGFEGDRIITKGDNNKVKDDFTVKAEDVVGVPVALIPFAGYVVSAIRENGIRSYIVTVLIPSLYIIASELRDAKGERRGRSPRTRRFFSARRFVVTLTLYSAVFYFLSSPLFADVAGVRCVEFTNSTTGYSLGKTGISEIIPVFWTVSASRISPVLPYLIPLAISITATLLSYPLWLKEVRSRFRRR